MSQFIVDKNNMIKSIYIKKNMYFPDKFIDVKQWFPLILLIFPGLFRRGRANMKACYQRKRLHNDITHALFPIYFILFYNHFFTKIFIETLISFIIYICFVSSDKNQWYVVSNKCYLHFGDYWLQQFLA